MFITESPPKVKFVDDLTITFTNGLALPITIDKESGDKVDWDSHEHAIVIHKTAKVNPDGESKTAPEDITLFRSHIIMIEHRVREITELTPNQKKEIWKLTQQEIGGTIQ